MARGAMGVKLRGREEVSGHDREREKPTAHLPHHIILPFPVEDG